MAKKKSGVKSNATELSFLRDQLSKKDDQIAKLQQALENQQRLTAKAQQLLDDSKAELTDSREQVLRLTAEQDKQQDEAEESLLHVTASVDDGLREREEDDDRADVVAEVRKVHDAAADGLVVRRAAAHGLRREGQASPEGASDRDGDPRAGVEGLARDGCGLAAR